MNAEKGQNGQNVERTISFTGRGCESSRPLLRSVFALSCVIKLHTFTVSLFARHSREIGVFEIISDSHCGKMSKERKNIGPAAAQTSNSHGSAQVMLTVLG